MEIILILGFGPDFVVDLQITLSEEGLWFSVFPAEKTKATFTQHFTHLHFS